MKLSVENLNSHYGPAHILFDVALEVGEGEAVALLGRNGAGKSTTFRSIVGLVAQRNGRIQFEGHDIQNWPTHAIVRGGLGYVPEERRIFTDLTVDEKISKSAASRRGQTRRNGRASGCSSCFPISRKCAAGRAAHERRRAADAHHRADADGQPLAGAAR